MCQFKSKWVRCQPGQYSGEDITFDAAASVGSGGARTQSHHHGRKNGALAAAVLAHDEVDALVQIKVEVLVAHEVLQRDVAQDSRRLWLPCRQGRYDSPTTAQTKGKQLSETY